VLLGCWLLFRDSLPAPVRRPIATLGGLALLAYGILAAAATVASGSALTRSGIAPGIGHSPFVDSVPLDLPISAGQTFSVANPTGQTTIHGGDGSTVHVVATRHYSFGGQAPDVRLTPDSNGVSLLSSTSRGRFPFGDSSWVEYTVEVPAGVQVKAQSSSGELDVEGVNGAVEADSTSGQVKLSNLGGPVVARASSGSLTLSNIAGDVRATTTSGKIEGTQLQHLREASASSGSVSLEGTFKDAAQIHTSSGSVELKLLPDSAIQLDVKSNSGSVNPQGGLYLTGGSTTQHTLTGTLGSPMSDAVLSIQTSSGSIQISQ
jgi:hypothetical protein